MKLCHLLWTSPSPNRGHQYQNNLPRLTEVQWDISDLPFIRNKDYQSLVISLYGRLFLGLR